MSSSITTRREQGFTLVELAIVLVIVGLLIGGILKGQELIATTRVTSTASQIRAIEAATNTFYDTYGNMPGDLLNVNTRLPNCATAGSVCNIAGNGNGQITQAPTAAMTIAAGSENTAFFGNLAAADLISGVLPTSTVVLPGQGAMGTPIGNGSYYRVGYNNATAITDAIAAATPPGHYLTILSLAAATAVTAGSLEGQGIQPKAAQKIDAKYDDGAPNTGTVLAGNTTAVGAAAGCAATGAAGTYNSQNTDNDCGVFIRFYQ